MVGVHCHLHHGRYRHVFVSEVNTLRVGPVTERARVPAGHSTPAAQIGVTEDYLGPNPEQTWNIMINNPPPFRVSTQLKLTPTLDQAPPPERRFLRKAEVDEACQNQGLDGTDINELRRASRKARQSLDRADRQPELAALDECASDKDPNPDQYENDSDDIEGSMDEDEGLTLDETVEMHHLIDAIAGETDEDKDALGEVPVELAKKQPIDAEVLVGDSTAFVDFLSTVNISLRNCTSCTTVDALLARMPSDGSRDTMGFRMSPWMRLHCLG